MKIILHAGFHKTATTMIQRTLENSSDTLRRHGVGYTQHREFRKHFTIPCHRILSDGSEGLSKSELERTRAQMATFIEGQLKTDTKRAIFSDENIVGHCGQIVKHSRFYPRQGRYLYNLHSAFPRKIDEIHVVVRSYDSFLSSCYVEYLRSFLPTATSIVQPDEFSVKMLNNESGWVDVVDKFRSKFKDSRIIVWQFEKIIKNRYPFFESLLGCDVDPQNLELPDEPQRTGMTSEAVENILRIAQNQGVKKAADRRLEVQDKFSNGTKFTLWSDEQKKLLAEKYAIDLELIQNRYNHQDVSAGNVRQNDDGSELEQEDQAASRPAPEGNGSLTEINTQKQGVAETVRSYIY